jgi:uncharacterized RDD family membrane protein YckC
MQKFKYTSFWDRLLAGMVDGIVVIPLGVIQLQFIDVDSPQTAFYIEALVTAAVFYGYSIFMHHKFGQTLGKMALSIKVIDEGEETMNITLKQAFLRDCIPLAFDMIILSLALVSLVRTDHFDDSYFDLPETIWFLVELITMMSNSKRRATHDFLANTVVVKI